MCAGAYRVLHDPEAADVAQEVFLKFYRGHPADAPYASAWLHRVAVRTALNHLRTATRRNLREQLPLVSDSQQSEDPAAVVERRQLRQQVRRVLGRLPQKSAALLALRYGGFSYQEVARALGVPANQVGTLLRRAEASFLKEIERESHR